MEHALTRALSAVIAALLFLLIVRFVQKLRKKKRVVEPSQEEILHKITFFNAVYAGAVGASMLLALLGMMFIAYFLVQTNGNMWSLVFLVFWIPFIYYARFSAKFQWSVVIAEEFEGAAAIFKNDPLKCLAQIENTPEYLNAIKSRPPIVQKALLRFVGFKNKK